LKKLVLVLSFISGSLVAQENTFDSQYSVGVGLGAIYSGLGANFALLSDRDMKYISAGCVEYSSMYGSTCGIGAGWIVTDLFNSNSNKHGVGVYVTKAGSESQVYLDDNGFNFVENQYYGAGVSYTYFMNGINKPGFNFGISAHATNAKYDEKINGFLQVGYQF
jgi:hypothetical protein